MMVYIVRSLNYCSVVLYNLITMHSLHMFYEFITILVQKNYITFFDLYRTLNKNNVYLQKSS